MSDPAPDSGFVMSPGLYNKVKFFVLTVLPASSTLYFTLGAVWGLPAVEQVVGTLAAVATFLGVLVGIASNTFKKSDARFDGVVNIEKTTEGGLVYSLELHSDPAELGSKNAVTFKVNPPS